MSLLPKVSSVKHFTNAVHREIERQQPSWNSSLLMLKVYIPLRQRLWPKGMFRCVFSEKYTKRKKRLQEKPCYVLSCIHSDMIWRYRCKQKDDNLLAKQFLKLY